MLIPRDGDVVVRLDDPLAIPADEDLHQLSSHDAVGRYGHSRRHGGHAVHFVRDVDDSHVGRDESDAANDLALRGAPVERRQNLAMTLEECGGTVDHRSEDVRERHIRRERNQC